jgi:hypothetical protein
MDMDMDMDMNTDTGTVEGQECQTLGQFCCQSAAGMKNSGSRSRSTNGFRIPELVHKRIKGTQFDSFWVQYQTERMDR